MTVATLTTYTLTAADVTAILAQRKTFSEWKGNTPKVGDVCAAVTVSSSGDLQVLLDGNDTLFVVPATPPPPPPPTGFFLPAPAGWKSVLQEDFTKATSLPSGDWTYGGRPGGTSGCQWESSQLTFKQGVGAQITTKWDSGLSSWISAGLGTSTSYSFPLRVRVYDYLNDANIVGLNKLWLLWCNPWIEEVDVDECAVAQAGSWQPTISRIHNGSSANVTNPISQTRGQPLNTNWCTEAELTEINGVPTITIFINGVQSGSAVIPAKDWATFLANPHWVGIQNELYSVGVAPQSAVSVRTLLGVEIFQPA